MSLSTRKLILAAAAVAMTAAVSAPAFAVGHGGHMGGSHMSSGGRLSAVGHGTSMRLPPRGGHVWNHPRFHRVFIGGRWIVRPVGFIEPVAVAAPVAPVVAPLCNCLTKEYTQDGQVVFKDLCTKEMAAAPVAGVEPQKSSETPSPNNFAGKTYQDYLASNGTQQN